MTKRNTPHKLIPDSVYERLLLAVIIGSIIICGIFECNF